LARLDRTAGRVARGVHADARIPTHIRRGVLAGGLRAPARPSLPFAQALGGAALLWRRKAESNPARAHPPRRALRRLGGRERRLGARRAAALLARRLSPLWLGRGERAAPRPGQCLG